MMEEIKPKKERKFLKAMGDIALILFRELVLGIGKKVINKVGNKRQGLVIAFLLVAGISYAFIDSIPYPVTGNKQRLGWQTSGNGLVYRGRSNDTITKPSSYVDKNVKAYLLLDSVRGTIFVWRQTYWDSILVGGGGGTFAQPIDSLFFNTGVPTNNVDTAKMRWDSDLATVVLGLNDNVPNEIGFKNFWLVKNQTGSTIAKGSLVYANGTVGASGRITVAKFIANGSIDAKYLLGITAHDLTDGEDGYVISFGKIRQVNTDTFAAGAILYPSPTVAGVWTDVEPVAPNIDMPIGFCINSSVNNGTIAIRVASGYKLSELHDVSISSPIEKASLYYSGGLWRDTTAALLVSDTASMLTPYFRDADTVTLSNRINLKLNISDTSAFARDNQISGTSGQVAYFNSSNSVISDAGLIYNATNKSLGINTTTTSGANLIIKNSQEPVRSTVVATQTFDADTTNWTRGAGWTFNGTQAVATAATGDLTYTPSLTITSGNAYEILYTVTNYSTGTLTVAVGNATYSLPTHNASNNIVLLLPTIATGGFRFTTSIFTGNLDNVRVVQISNPAPILIASQDDNTTTLYNVLTTPNSTSISLIGGGRYSTSINNVFIGENTGNLNTGGNNNNFIGFGAGSKNTDGRFNNFFGSEAGLNNTIGFSNNFFGNEAGKSNTTGVNNNFFGSAAGRLNANGSYNNFFGASAGQNTTSGGRNNFFGDRAGRENITGNDNNFFGLLAGVLNTGGSRNNFFGSQAGFNNQASDNNFFGSDAGFSNTTGNNHIMIGNFTGRSNTTGTENIFIGRRSGEFNTTGNFNIALGGEAGYYLRSGSFNIILGDNSGPQNVGDTLLGSSNILIGRGVADNIAGAAAGNVAIGNAVDLPINNGSNQGVYQNVLFFTGASGTGTTIAAASKAGIKTNAPNRDLEVAGEVRITDLTTDAPTRLVGADADGDLGQVTLGAGLSLASSSLLADTSFLVTRFDTASMLTPYFRDADTTSLNLTSRFAAKLNLSDTASMLTNYLRTGTAASTYLTQSNAASTYLPLTGGTLTGGLTGTNVSLNSNLTISDIIPNNPPPIYTSVTTGPSTSATVKFGLNQSLGSGGANMFMGGSQLGGGSATNPNIFFTDTRRSYASIQGIYTGAGITSSGHIAFNTTPNDNTTALTERMRIASDGAITIGGTLGVTGATTLNESLTVNRAGVPLFINSTNSNLNKISLQDNTTVRSYLGAGSTKLFTVANSSVDEKFSVSNDGNTVISGSITVNSSAVFNEGSTDSDFRVESDGNANMVFVDASTDRVGIGTNSPTKTLDVNGELNVLSAGTFGGRLNTNWMERTYSNSTATSLTVSVNTTWLKLENNSTITLTLPNAATYPGKELHIKNAGTGAVNSLSSNIEPLNSTTIGTAILASGGGKWATLVSDGTYWVIMAGN